MNAIEVRLLRNEAEESRHRVHGVLVETEPDAVRPLGDPGLATFWRSSMKPFQALPLVEDGLFERLGLGSTEIAIACASHHGTPEHLAAVGRILAACGLGEEHLACGGQRPLDEAAARSLDERGTLPGRIHNNCSGKHAAMLARCRDRGWDLESYHELVHPLQQEIRDALSRWIDGPPAELEWGVDGCGLPTPRLSIEEMARAYARLTASKAPGPRAVVAAMTEHPSLVSGSSGFSYALMRAAGGRILAKAGAEGVFCLGEIGSGRGAAFKVRDGAMRAIGPAVLYALEAWGLAGEGLGAGLSAFEPVVVENTRGEPVAHLTARASMPAGETVRR